jgi:hypothetical protein
MAALPFLPDSTPYLPPTPPNPREPIFIFGIDELFEFSMVGCKIDGCLIFHEKAEKSLRHIPA